MVLERGGDIDLVPKLVLGDNLDTAVAFLGDVDRGAVTDIVLHIAESLRHVAGGTIVGADAERVLFPSAQIVDFERVGIGRRQVGITVGDRRRVGNVLEGVELTTPRTMHTTCVVELHFVVVGNLPADEGCGENLVEGIQGESYKIYEISDTGESRRSGYALAGETR